MNPLHYLSAALLSLLLGGCVSFHPAGPIGDPARTAEITEPRAAMLADAQVSDSEIDADQRAQLARQFSQQLHKRVEKGAYFEEVLSFPATLGEEDVLLKFNFTQLQGQRTPHPAYFPGALLTLTVWIWANGPIYVDSYNLAGELKIEDAHGKQLALSQKAIAMEQNTGLWDADYMSFSLGAAQLNQLVEQLLQDSTAQLATSKTQLSSN
jgi:hypothetical protein